MKICFIAGDQSDGLDGSHEQFTEETGSDGDESMWLSSDSSSSSPPLFSESCWRLLDSFPDFLLSLVNLDEEDSKLIADGELDFDWFLSGFPSPSFRSGLDFEVKLAGARAIGDVDPDEPIFWPIELKIDWKSMEDWDWFSISPRKDLRSSATPPNSTGFRFEGRKMNLNQAPKRRLVFSSRSAASEMMELKQRQDKRVTTVPRIGTVPSRFNRAIKNSAGKRSGEKLFCVDRDFLETDLAENEELPIETLSGLREFDGREGIDSEFDDVVLSLDETCNELA
ncbi:uncharacterized protein LOC111014703 [Momordica charantia]|uniref:Uncharacterized protein LOC111014703 n=1 Tax=Momordica charantia TaxID=3673 RepID=A0A6J1CVX3_MOMCH|nr:uncharacterized protein LOC111014703 [Momordica charantia]